MLISPGTQVDRYHIIEQLGEGGMAVVYKAFDTRLECEVAVKIIRMERLTQEMMASTLKRFEREAKAVAQLTHANIIKVTDYGEHEGVPYLVMEYLPGGTLKQYLGKPMPYQEAAHLLAPVARALQYAHSRNIVHRDVKPSNILITESGEPILTDFGIAKILDLNDGQTLTGTGVGIGTPEYMAPEQWKGEVTPAVDIYSLGVVFYELVTGHKPYTAETPAAVLLKQATEPLPRPSSYVPGIPEKVERVIYKAMAKKAEDRYETMQEFESALEQLRAGVGVPATRERKPVPTRDDQFTTRDTSTTKLETLVERDLKDTDKPIKPEITREQPPSRMESEKPSNVGIFAGLGALVFIALFFVIGNATNWFRGIQATMAPTVAPTQLLSTDIPTPTETPTLGIGSTMISEIDGMEMVYVPAGEFLMGSPDGVGYDDEQPQHTVYLDAYWIDKTEVTNGMYEKCVAEGACSKPVDLSSYTRDSYYGNPTYAGYPVIYITWYQAQDYCAWAGRELPTEAQWEKAARGEGGSTFPWGEESPAGNLANFADVNSNFDWSDRSIDDGYADTDPVGNYPDGASPYGALDMAGNVWEWTGDWYDVAYYSESYQNNPTGPVNGDYRSLRGGSWNFNELNVRSADRHWYYPSGADNVVGFRCSSSR